MTFSTQKTLRSVTLLAMAGAVTQLLGFGYRVLLARLVPAEHLGLYHLVMPVYSVLSAVCLSGLTVCAVRLTAQYRALGSTRAGPVLLTRLLRVFGLLFLLACLVLIPGSGLLAQRILGDRDAAGGILLLLPLLLQTELFQMTSLLHWRAILTSQISLLVRLLLGLQSAQTLSHLWVHSMVMATLSRISTTYQRALILMLVSSVMLRAQQSRTLHSRT